MRPVDNEGDALETPDPDTLPRAGNADEQAEQAAELVEPVFDHHLEDEAALLEAEFGEPDADGWYGRHPETTDDAPTTADGDLS